MLLSVVIPSKDDPSGLYHTFAASFVELENDFPGNSEIIVACDGETNDATDCLQKNFNVIRGNWRAPQKARHAGLLEAKGKWVAFLDSHVIPSRGMFRRLVEAAEANDAGIVHSPHCFWARNQSCFAYRIDWVKKFWMSESIGEPIVPQPYRVSVMGHGAMVVDREKYLASGGYLMEQRGWGGEEPHLNLKFWMLGYSSWVHPDAYHWHFMARRHSADIYKSPEFIRNFMLAAYALGGQKYLDSVYGSYSIASRPYATVAEAIEHRNDPDPYRDDYLSVPNEMKEERARICAGPFAGNLDALREFFDRERIIN
jgi:glycosyltransferase involved in cell wall biosynthesis